MNVKESLTLLVAAMLVFALSPPMAFAQTPETTTVSIKLIDISPSGAPRAFTGTIKCSEWVESAELRVLGEGTVDAVNMSQRQIVAWAATTITNCLHAGPHGVRASADHFFRNHSLPDNRLNISISFNEGMALSEDGKRKDPHDLLLSAVSDPTFTAELIFVQFDDGSTWGSKDAAAQIVAERDAVQTFLKRLSAASTNESIFLTILGEDQASNTSVQNVSTQLKTLQGKSGTAAVVAKVESALQAAALRRTRGAF